MSGLSIMSPHVPRDDVAQTRTSDQKQQLRDNLGLGSASTYSAAALPISTATQAALDAKAPSFSVIDGGFF